MVKFEEQHSILGYLKKVPEVLYAKPGKAVLYLKRHGRYHAPIFVCYKETIPCELRDLMDLPVIIKWGKDLDLKGVERTYIFVHHYSNIIANHDIRMLVVDEKDVMAGAWIQYRPISSIIDESFYSRGGTHWERFILTTESVIHGTRVTATRNNHNQYEVTA